MGKFLDDTGFTRAAQQLLSRACSRSYTVTFPASAWTYDNTVVINGQTVLVPSLASQGVTYSCKALQLVPGAQGTGKGLIVEPTSGSAADLQAWGVVDVSAGKVTLYSTAPLTGDITLRITEVF